MIISDLRSADMGAPAAMSLAAIALMSNIVREILALTVIPVIGAAPRPLRLCSHVWRDLHRRHPPHPLCRPSAPKPSLWALSTASYSKWPPPLPSWRHAPPPRPSPDPLSLSIKRRQRGLRQTRFCKRMIWPSENYAVLFVSIISFNHHCYSDLHEITTHCGRGARSVDGRSCSRFAPLDALSVPLARRLKDRILLQRRYLHRSRQGRPRHSAHHPPLV